MIGTNRDFCGLSADSEPVWLTYAEAARRVKSSIRTVNRWRRTGMPMQWRVDDTGQRFRVVEEQVLLSWWRDRMEASPVHFYRLRRKLIDAGETPPPLPDRFKLGPKPTTERAQNAIQPQPGHSQVSEGTDSPQHTSDRILDVLADLPVFRGQAEHAALMKAMERETPACDGLEVFTRDRFDDPEEVEMMRGICQDCPLITLCAVFAAAGKPTAGMWAGMTPAEIRRASTRQTDRTLAAAG